jgi:hypothetical protein
MSKIKEGTCYRKLENENKEIWTRVFQPWLRHGCMSMFFCGVLSSDGPIPHPRSLSTRLRICSFIVRCGSEQAIQSDVWKVKAEGQKYQLCILTEISHSLWFECHERWPWSIPFCLSRQMFVSNVQILLGPMLPDIYLLTHSLTHSMVQGIIWKADSHSAYQKISCFLMEPEGSLPCSQKPTIRPYPEPAESSSPNQSLSP